MLFLNRSHVQSLNTGIFLENRPQANVTGNLIYQSGAGVAGNFVGIYVAGGSYEGRLSNNVVSAPAYNASFKIGIVIDSQRSTLMGNSFSAMTYGVWLTGSASGCTAVGNIAAAGGGITVLNSGTGNVVGVNNP